MTSILEERIALTISSNERCRKLFSLARTDAPAALARIFSDKPGLKFRLARHLVEQRIAPALNLMAKANRLKDERKKVAIAAILADHLINFGPLTGHVGLIGDSRVKGDTGNQSDGEDPCAEIQIELDNLGDRARDLWDMYFNCRMGGGSGTTDGDENDFFFVGGIDLPEIGTVDDELDKDDLSPIPVPEDDCAELWAQLTAVSAEWTELAGELSLCRAAQN